MTEELAETLLKPWRLRRRGSPLCGSPGRRNRQCEGLRQGLSCVFEGRQGAPAGGDEGREVMPQITQGLWATVGLWALRRAPVCKAVRSPTVKEPSVTVLNPALLLSDHRNLGVF